MRYKPPGIKQIYILWYRCVGQKRCYFEKQTGEVIENTRKGYINSQKQTGKQSGEVVENTCLWKKLTGNKPENKATDHVENKASAKWVITLGTVIAPETSVQAASLLLPGPLVNRRSIGD